MNRSRMFRESGFTAEEFFTRAQYHRNFCSDIDVLRRYSKLVARYYNRTEE